MNLFPNSQIDLRLFPELKNIEMHLGIGIENFHEESFLFNKDKVENIHIVLSSSQCPLNLTQIAMNFGFRHLKIIFNVKAQLVLEKGF